MTDILTFGGDSAPARYMPEVGDEIEGTVTGWSEVQERRFERGPDGAPLPFADRKLAFWDDGKPKMQIVLDMDDDNGESFRLYLEWQMKRAVGDAIRESGATGLTVGGRVKIRRIEGVPNKFGTISPQYKARYTAPAPASVSLDDF